jgi:hypothetical protein
MLDMKPKCERCGESLSWTSPAYICSYECTFCPACKKAMAGKCPNCDGELVSRPVRLPKPTRAESPSTEHESE